MRLRQCSREAMQEEQLFSYCTFEQERLRDIVLPHPLLGIVLWGKKEIWLGERCIAFEAGSIFAAPARVPVTLVNIPDEGAGRYETMALQVTMLPAALPPAQRVSGSTSQSEFGITLTPDLADAIVHAARTIHDIGAAPHIRQLRYAEVLSLLRPMANARCLFEAPAAAQVAWAVRSDPSRAWTAGSIATLLNISSATLRRWLAAEGTSFRSILVAQRMNAARLAMQAGAFSVEAAETAGYASRSHFSKRYREMFGESPTGR